MEAQIIKEKDNTTTVKFAGKLDTPAAQEIAKSLVTLQDEPAKGTIVLDCKELEYISSSGLRIFLTLRKAAEAKGGKVIVKDINEEIRNVFMMTGFLNIFEIV